MIKLAEPSIAINRATVSRVLDTGGFINGLAVHQFEHACRRWLELSDDYTCISCANGTDALRLALLAAGIRSGDRVGLPDYTFVATLNAVTSVGAEPVLLDVSPQTGLLNGWYDEFDTIKALISVDLFGNVPALVVPKHLTIIEDACQAFGSRRKNGNLVGNSRHSTCFSFHPAKLLGAAGDAGMIVTHYSNADHVRALAKNGRSPSGDFVAGGFNSRMDTLQAAILLDKLASINLLLSYAKNNYTNLAAACDDAGVEYIKHQPGSNHSYFILRGLKNRTAVRALFADHRIETKIYYEKPLHLLCNLPLATNNTTLGSLTLAEGSLAIPCHPLLTPAEKHVLLQTIYDIKKEGLL